MAASQSLAQSCKGGPRKERRKGGREEGRSGLQALHPVGSWGCNLEERPCPVPTSSLPSPFNLSWAQHLPAPCHQPRGHRVRGPPQPGPAQGGQGPLQGHGYCQTTARAWVLPPWSEGISEGTHAQLVLGSRDVLECVFQGPREPQGFCSTELQHPRVSSFCPFPLELSLPGPFCSQSPLESLPSHVRICPYQRLRLCALCGGS